MMTGSVGNHVLDFDLDTLVIDTTAICLCISEPTAYALAKRDFKCSSRDRWCVRHVKISPTPIRFENRCL